MIETKGNGRKKYARSHVFDCELFDRELMVIACIGGYFHDEEKLLMVDKNKGNYKKCIEAIGRRIVSTGL